MKITVVLLVLSALSIHQGAAQDVRAICLNAHNKLRRLHEDTPDVTWDANLAAESQRWAEELLQKGFLQHSRGNYGENLFMASGSWGRSIDCAMASLSWYNEEKHWDYNAAKGSGGITGHFTQLVWKESTKIGVGIASGKGGVYIVARYTPQGNFWGQYKQNVMHKRLGAKTPTEQELRTLDGTLPTDGPPKPPVTQPPLPPVQTTEAPPRPRPESGVAALCLNAHNKLRRLHQNTPDVSWDASLAASSQQWAEKLLQKGALQHSRGNYGENLFMASGSWGQPIDCAMASLSWYNEEIYWNYKRASGSGHITGHFTQLVWKSTTKIGVGIASGRGGTYIVARYTPAGNYGGRYKANVMLRKPGVTTPNEEELRKLGGTLPTDRPRTDIPPPTLPPATEAPPPPVTHRPPKCQDTSFKCRWLKNKCRRNRYVRRRCQKTCGGC